MLICSRIDCLDEVVAEFDVDGDFLAAESNI